MNHRALQKATITLVLLTVAQLCQADLNYTFEITTDDYPDETTWTLTKNGVTIYSGGPYQDANTLYTEEFILDSGFCYIFTIDDEFGDGICCGYGLGGYAILDDSGNTVISGGEFFEQEIQEFCIGFTPCNLSSTVDVTNESGPGTMDGSISAVDGTPPYEFSIDGGGSFQSSGLFENVGVGFYSIEVKDDNECEHTRTVAVAVISAVDDHSASGIKAYPNPAKDELTIEIPKGDSNGEQLNCQVLDASGREVGHAKLAVQAGVYRGSISLLDLDQGVYFISWWDGTSNRMIRVVKE